MLGRVVAIFNSLVAGNYQVEVRNSDGSCIVAQGIYEVVQISRLKVTVPNTKSPTDCGAKDVCDWYMGG